MTSDTTGGREPAALRPVPGDWRRALAVVAHPDDLEHGCSAAIAHWSDGQREIVELFSR